MCGGRKVSAPAAPFAVPGRSLGRARLNPAPAAIFCVLAAASAFAGADVAPCPAPRTTHWWTNLVPHDPTEAKGFGSTLQVGRDWVATGDVDADGADDIVIGLPECQLVDCFDSAGAGPFGQRRPIVQVYSGRTGALLHELVSPTASTLNGILNLSSYGTQLAVADINGDGHADIAVSAPFENVDISGGPAPESSVGAVHVFSGATGELLYQIKGVTPGRSLGFSSAFVGDWDGDDKPDLLLSTRATFQEGDYIGDLRLHSGATGAFISAAPFVGDIVATSVRVANIGDTNGDGEDDAAVATRAGIPGPPLITIVTSSALDQSLSFVVSDSLGKAPAPKLGDMDGDGLADIALWRLFFDGSQFIATLEITSVATGAIIGDPIPIPGSPRPPTVVGIGDTDGDGVSEMVAGPFPIPLTDPLDAAIRGELEPAEDRVRVLNLDGACEEQWRTLALSGDGDAPGTQLTATYSSMVAGDFDGDTILDLAAVGVPTGPEGAPPLHLRQLNIFRRPGCPEDLTGDGLINFADLALLLDTFNDEAAPGQLPADINGDGQTGFDDLNAILGRFNSGC